jgi:hypothetical protein
MARPSVYLLKSTQEHVSKSGRNRSVLIANETLYQLSYTPVVGEISALGRFFIN